MFIGIELVKNKKTKEPAVAEAKRVVLELRKNYRILITVDGPLCNVIKFKPPICFAKKGCQSSLQVT